MSGKQLTFTTLGGDVVTVAQRGKHYIEPRGYYFHPGTGPAGETCGSCKHRTFGRYIKCNLNRARWTGGRGSDILAGAPACKYWESPTPISEQQNARLAETGTPKSSISENSCQDKTLPAALNSKIGTER